MAEDENGADELAHEDTDDAAEGELDIEREATLTQADFANAVRYLPGAKRPWLVPGLFAVAMLILNAFNPFPSLIGVLPAAVIAGLLFFAHGSAQRGWVKRAFSEQGGVPTKFRFDDFGLGAASSLRQHRLAWATLVRQLETPHSFLVYTSPQTLLVIPKRVFAEDEVDEIRRALRTRMVQRAVPTARASLPRAVVLWAVLVTAFLAIWHWLGRDAAPRREREASHAVTPPSTPPSAGDEGGEGGDDDSGEAEGEAKDVDSSP